MLPVFYLIMWVMKAPKSFGKIAILKIWELIFIGGVKTHFGKLALKWCIFKHEKKIFQLRLCHCIWSNSDIDTKSTSKWPPIQQICERSYSSWLKIGQKWPSYGHLWIAIFIFFSYKIEKTETKRKLWFMSKVLIQIRFL